MVQAHARANEISKLAAASSESILNSVDPYGTGMYKGKFIGEPEVTAEDSSKFSMPIESLSQGVSVGFKKRKRPVNQMNTNAGANSSSSSSTVKDEVTLNTTAAEMNSRGQSVEGTIESKSDDENGTNTHTPSTNLKTNIKLKVVKKTRDIISYDD